MSRYVLLQIFGPVIALAASRDVTMMSQYVVCFKLDMLQVMQALKTPTSFALSSTKSLARSSLRNAPYPTSVADPGSCTRSLDVIIAGEWALNSGRQPQSRRTVSQREFNAIFDAVEVSKGNCGLLVFPARFDVVGDFFTICAELAYESHLAEAQVLY